MTGKKITELSQATSVLDTDLLVLVDNISTIPTNKKVQLSQVIPDSTSLTKGRLRLNKDLGGTAENPLVVGIQGTPVSAEAPVEGDTLIYRASSANYQPTAVPVFNVISINEFIETPTVKAYVLDLRASSRLS